MPGGQHAKHPSVRARRNVSASAAVLRPLDPDEIVIPDLPERCTVGNGEITDWHIQTLAWWDDIWSSPMAPEYHISDIHGLIALALLWDVYWRNPNRETHAEVRLARKDYGQTPLDRRRLQWQIETTEEAQDKGKRRRNAAAIKSVPVEAEDPRFDVEDDGPIADTA